ncbi:hypothetical protein OAQ45_00200 [Candidatus Marinimicrobia bacterium]|nr:hypothetical protein [Candidatus Neomarinimicrobiota bacterium]
MSETRGEQYGNVDGFELTFNAEQSISYLVAEANVYNEWQEAMMWQHICHIMRQRKNNRRWTKAELNRMMAEAEDE